MARRRDGQDAWEGYGAVWSMIGTLLAGLAVWGGIGFLVDRLAGTHDVFLAIGLVVGAIGGVLFALVPVALYEAYLARRGRVAELIVDADRAATAAAAAKPKGAA